MQRTTVRLDEPLLAEAKKFAAETGTSLTAVIENALREVLSRRRAPKTRKQIKFTTFRGKGLGPGVNLDDSAALLDLMEGRQDR